MSRQEHRVPRAFVVLVVGCAALGACTSAPAPMRPSSAGTLPADALAGLSVAVSQARLDREHRVVQVDVTNDGGTDVVVASARLRTPGAHGAATSTRERAVRSGVTRSLSVALGTPRCDGDDGPAQVQLTVRDDAGRTGTWQGAPDDPTGVLPRVAGEDCAAAAVAAGAVLSLSDDVAVTHHDGRTTGSVRLHLRPVDGGPRIRVTGVDSTTLLTPAGGAARWTVTLDSSAGATSVDLAFEPARCDAHAVAEDKRGTFLGVRADVAGVPQPVFYLTPSDDLRAALRSFVASACGWPAG